MSLYDGLSVETAPLQGSLAELTSQPSPPETKDEEKTSWNTKNFKLMASQLQRQKATRGVGRGRGGLRGRGLSTLSVQVSSMKYGNNYGLVSKLLLKSGNETGQMCKHWNESIH